tara:strand:- start:355 stop:1416 length:1062 start_codon:yes stop_codon:yes gene_type:complete
MAYLGARPTTNFRVAPTKDTFTGDGSTTTFDLANVVPAGGENALQVFVENVRQEPGSGKAYTLGADGSGDLKRITFSSAPASSAEIYVITTFSNEAFAKIEDLKGSEFVLDADGDTTITADTDDQIDIKIAGADDFQFTANTFTAQSGSTIAAQALTATTITPSSNIDMNGTELILDADADTSITADTDDRIDIKIANTDHVSFGTSSGDTVIKPMTDAKDIIIQQFDGTELVNFNDGAYSSFTSAAINPEATLTDASTISWNALTQPVAKVTLGANRTLGAASGGVAGAFVSLLIIQDGTGSRTVTFNAAYEFKDDTAPTLTTTAAKGDLFVFRYNGSKWLEVGRNQNLTLS